MATMPALADTAVPLPLMRRVAEDSVTFHLTPGSPVGDAAARARHADKGATPAAQRLPGRKPGPGEQYRFHVDMRKCIGCQCCVVACNEQNGNPAAITWRRVGEIEGGFYPETTRSFLSMGCNHCLEPTCLAGCPVDAYTKDAETGIVLHSADTCIGCQYCTWNCSYGVPKFNAERGVVSKCDMCHGRLSLGQSPACVSACPTGAITIEIVKMEDWRAAVAQAPEAAGLPAGDHSLSTTRVTLPTTLSPNTRPVSAARLMPEDPHWPLVIMTVLTQLSVGAFTAIWMLHILGATAGLGVAALASLSVGGLALAASTLHLGRPMYAYRALKMWRRSWLSREVLLFGGFSAVAGAYAAALWLGSAAGPVLGALTVLLGVGGVTASAQIYRVSSRPTWNSLFTLVQFVLTAGTLGPLAAAALGAGGSQWLVLTAATFAAMQLVTYALRYLHQSVSENTQLQSAAKLLATRFAATVVWRAGLLAVGAVALPLYSREPVALWLGLALAVGAELLGRYLFFVTAVPRHMVAAYVGDEAA